MRPILVALLLQPALPLVAQPITSVADGDWNDPSTWDCACVPDGIVSVTVAHTVIVTQPDSLLDGDLYIQSDGQLLGTSLVVGGIFFNFGQVTLQALEIKPGILQPDAVNFGTLAAIRLGLQREAFTNLGDITADSIRTDVAWENAPVGSVATGWLAGQGQLDNRGSVTGSGTFAARFRNDSSITWSGLFRVPYTSVNLGNIAVVGDLRIEALLQDSGLILVEGDVRLDGDLLLASDSAYLSIAGDLRVAGLLRGAGSVCITDTTVNAGVITDSVDVCDKSPTATAPPYLDVDQGVVGPDVRWCTDPRCLPVGIDGPHAPRNWSVWPVPSAGPLWTAPVPANVKQVELIDATGRRTRRFATRHGEGLLLDLSDLAAGPYLIRLPEAPLLTPARVLVAR
jgi:hypothetical protein